MAPEPDLHVLVFGGIESGKTSLLAAMWDSVNVRLRPAGYTVQPDIDDHHVLDEARMNLQGAFTTDKGPYWRAVDATELPQQLRLYVGPKAGGPDLLTIVFTDTPGEYAERTLSGLTTRFGSARGGILAVDSVELMHGEREIPSRLRRNRPGVIARGMEEWLRLAPAEDSLLLVVALTKCETWLRGRVEDGEPLDTAAGGRDLLERFEEVYAEPLGVLQEHARRVAVVVTPVQTVGNLVFEKYLPPADDARYPGEEYRKLVVAATPEQASEGYAPLDCDQPLRYLLNFALIERLEAAMRAIDAEVDDVVAAVPWYLRWAVEGQVADWMKALGRGAELVFGDSRDLARTVSRFVRQAKSDPPFVIVQGRPLLERSFGVWDTIDEVLGDG